MRTPKWPLANSVRSVYISQQPFPIQSYGCLRKDAFFTKKNFFDENHLFEHKKLETNKIRTKKFLVVFFRKFDKKSQNATVLHF